MTANPIMLAQQPTVAAPAARPSSPSIMQIAALLIGRVSVIPTTTETTAPMTSGCIFVAFTMIAPSAVIMLDTYGPTNCAASTPVIMVTAGVTIMSRLVSFETTFPSSTAISVAQYTPTGPPSSFAASPTIAVENSTRGGACRP